VYENLNRKTLSEYRDLTSLQFDVIKNNILEAALFASPSKSRCVLPSL
jgi:hypothetical protein